MEQSKNRNNGTACEKIVTLLPAYQDGVLEDTLSLCVAEHLAACPACRKKHELLLSLPEAITQALPLPDDALHGEIMQAVRQTPRRKALSPYRLGVAVAAAVCLVATVAVLLSGGFGSISVKDSMAPESNAPADDWAGNAAWGDRDESEAEDKADGIILPPMEPEDSAPGGESESPSYDDGAFDSDAPGDAPSKPSKGDADISTEAADKPLDSDQKETLEKNEDDCPICNGSDQEADTYEGSLPDRLVFTPDGNGGWYCRSLALFLHFHDDHVVLSDTGITWVGTYRLSDHTIQLGTHGESVTFSFRLGWNELILTKK